MSEPKFSLVIEATFPTTARAQAYAEACNTPENWVRPGSFVHKGRKCSWTVDVPASSRSDEFEVMVDTVEQIGFYGSSTDRKATVTVGMDGKGFLCVNHPAPVAY